MFTRFIIITRVTARRLDQRIQEHGGKDNNSCIFRHSADAGHAVVNSNNSRIIVTGSKSRYTRKIAGALYIKHDKPLLNVQTMSVPPPLSFSNKKAFISLITLNQHN